VLCVCVLRWMLDTWSVLDFLYGMWWAVIGGIVIVAVVGYGFAKHVFYMNRVWALRRVFDNPPKVDLVPGPLTVVGTVSATGGEAPVQVTMREAGNASRGQIYWKQASYDVDVHPFALLVPELAARIIVEPSNDVELRAAARVTEWEYDKERKELYRTRTATIEDGVRVMVTGMLGEKREVDLIPGPYRPQKEIRTEYVLRSISNKRMTIDSATLFDEVRGRVGYVEWGRGIGFVALAAAYVHASQAGFSQTSVMFFGVVLGVYLVVRMFTVLSKDRLPWFDRPKDSKKPYHRVSDFYGSMRK
jgi:hypothetical protein